MSLVMYPSPIQNLIELFAKFTGVGPRQAARFVFYMLGESTEFRASLAQGITDIADALLTCVRCGNIEAKKDAEANTCSICRNTKRNTKQIAVVEDVTSLRALEQTHTYSGLYHVLGKVFNTKGEEPETVQVKKFIKRINDEHPDEIIIATSPTYEGDATARYLERELTALQQESAFKITRLARGLAKGVDIEYVDEETLREALTGRR